MRRAPADGAEAIKEAGRVSTSIRGDFRIKSVRAARREIELALEEHRNGRLTASGLTARVGALKAWTEVFLVEQELMKLSMDYEAGDHPLGVDGGLEIAQITEGAVHRLTSRTKEGAKGIETETVEVVTFLAPGDQSSAF